MNSNNSGRRTLAATFSATTPPATVRSVHSVSSLKALAHLEMRGGLIKEKALTHYKKFEDRWVAKEAMRIIKRHLSQAAPHPAPKGVTQSIDENAIMLMASRNVLARTHQRLARINSIKTRMGNAIVRNLAPPSVRHAFSQAAVSERPTQKQTMKR